MNTAKIGVCTLGLAAALLASPAAQAGRSCQARPLNANSITQGMNLAQRTAEALETEYKRSGAQVVVLARAGQDLSEYRLRYSHLGLAYRDTRDAANPPVWRVLHKLNSCGTSTASIYRQGLGEFFLDDPWRYQAAWVVPAPELQAPLHAMLTNPARSLALHHRAYNLVSYPWSTRYQQSNQWGIEMLAAAAAPDVRTREQAQAWLRYKNYQPSVLHINAFKRLGARVSAANVAFDDHPNSKRFSDRIETVTVDSVFEWLSSTGLGSSPQQINL